MAMFIKYPYMGADLYEWNIEEMCGYKPISTYYTDFGIAEKFGTTAVIDTFKRAIKHWGSDIKWATEIVMVMNWKIWEHNMRRNEDWEEFYTGLWEEAEKYVHENFEGEDLAYFYRTTD